MTSPKPLKPKFTDDGLKDVKEKPSMIIRRMAKTIEVGIQKVKTGDQRIDILVYQLSMLAAANDAILCYLDSEAGFNLKQSDYAKS